MESSEFGQSGVLIVSMYAEAEEDTSQLASWYKTTKIPAILGVPGVTGVTTWDTVWRYVPGPEGGQVAVDAPEAYTAIFELSDVNVVKTDAFLEAAGRDFESTATADGRQLKFVSELFVTCREIGRVENSGSDITTAGGLMVVSITPERAYIPLLNEWYTDVHLGELLVCPGMLGARRFRALEGIPNFFALYYLDRPEALKSPEFVQVSGRPFEQLPAITQRLGPHMKGNICDVYRLRTT